jgi:hypothetical protein
MTVGEMTLDELRQFIERVVEEKHTHAQPITHDKKASWEEIRARVEERRWTPPEGASASLALLRADREG